MNICQIGEENVFNKTPTQKYPSTNMCVPAERCNFKEHKGSLDRKTRLNSLVCSFIRK